jgi:hypothetical protein
MLDDLTDLSNVYRIILRLPLLKYHNLLTDHLNSLASLPVNTDQRFSIIEHLVIIHDCTFNDVLTIMPHTPQLYRLNYINTNSSDLNVEIISSITLSNLTDLSITRRF